MAEDENLRQFVESYLRGETSQKPTGKTFSLRYGRVASLAPYESCRVELEEEFDISVPRQVAFETLAGHVEELIASRKKIKVPIQAPIQR